MKKIIPFLFFFFLTSPILSPFIGGITVYLSAVIIIFDGAFIKWLQQRVTMRHLYELAFLFLLLLLACRNPAVVVKSVMLLSSTVYAYYAYVTDRYYLYQCITFNVFVALAQFAFLFINVETAIKIGPTNIAKTIWGRFAGPTNTNFYAISFLPRVSGLSREGGFFAALMGVSFFLLLYDKKISRKKKIIYCIIFSLGLMVSLSKATLVILIIPIIILFKRYINALGVLTVTVGYAIIVTIICYYIFLHTDFFITPSNITFIHRFAGYVFAPFIDLRTLLVGIKLTDLLSGVWRLPYAVIIELQAGNLMEFGGLPHLYLSYGIWPLIVFILFLRVLNFSALGVVLVLILTTNVTPITCDGFVILAWLFGYLIGNNTAVAKLEN